MNPVPAMIAGTVIEPLNPRSAARRRMAGNTIMMPRMEVMAAGKSIKNFE